MKNFSDSCLRLALLLGPVTLSVAIYAFGSRPSQPAASPPSAYSYRLMPASDSTYGYEIRQHARLVIRQLTVPGRPGTRGFVQPALARATASLAISKLSCGHLLPTITAHELDSLAASL